MCILTLKDSLERMRMRSLHTRMILECRGIVFRGRAATAEVREKYGIAARSKRGVIKAFERICSERDIRLA